MKHYPPKLLLVTNAVVKGVFFNPIGADINIGHYWLTFCRQTKSDDVGVVIMGEIFPVDFQEVFIGAENISN